MAPQRARALLDPRARELRRVDPALEAAVLIVQALHDACLGFLETGFQTLAHTVQIGARFRIDGARAAKVERVHGRLGRALPHHCPRISDTMAGSLSISPLARYARAPSTCVAT